MINIELLKAAVTGSVDGITISDFTKPDNPLIFINPAFEAMTGYKLEEIVNKNCRYLQGDDRDQPDLEVVRSAIKNGQSCSVTLRNYRKDGSIFWNELSLSPIIDLDGSVTNFLGVQRDVTSKVLLEENVRRENKGLKTSISMLKAIVNIDSLTGLYNRRFLDEQVDVLWETAIRDEEKLAVYMLDFDHFKKFNDIYGHQAGDLALKKVAKQLNKSFMKSTDFVARYGGEEFIIITVGMNENRVQKYAKTIVQRIRDLKIPHQESETGFLTVSLGYFITSPNVNENPQLAINQADKALYKSKKSGRNVATCL